MAGNMMKNLVVVLSCLGLFHQVSYAATVYKVGGSTGWTIPSSNSLYSSWASKQSFSVGDTLEFDFTTGQHTVAEVTKSAYDSCSKSNPISTETKGPANVTIKTAGAHYYICTVATHCDMGQKLAISTSDSAAAAPTAGGSPNGTTTNSTTSSAPGLHAHATAGMGFLVSLAAAAAAAFLY